MIFFLVTSKNAIIRSIIESYVAYVQYFSLQSGRGGELKYYDFEKFDSQNENKGGK